MPIPQFSSTTARLISAVGAGCQLMGDDGQLMVTFEYRESRTGLLLSTCIGDDNLDFWIDENEWCQWINSVITIPSFSLLPEEFKEILAQWTLDTVRTCFFNEDIPWPVAKQIKSDSLVQGMGWRLCATHKNSILNLNIVEAPNSWLETLIDYAMPIEELSVSEPIIIGAKLSVGWSFLNIHQIHTMQEGDALILQQQADISNGQFFLFTHKPLATIRQDNSSGIFIVEVVMNDFEDWIEVNIPAHDILNKESQITEALVPVSVEVANFNISLHELSKIKPGYLLESETHYSTPVSLKIGHRMFALGTLLRIGDNLAVRIDKLC